VKGGAARLLFLAGAVAIGLFLVRAAPRELTLVYGLEGQPARALTVDIRRGAETLRHAEFRFTAGAPPSVSHQVRLPDGDYVLDLTLYPRSPPGGGAAGGERRVERPISVTASGTIVIPLGS
jgi:hypothetical protein